MYRIYYTILLCSVFCGAQNNNSQYKNIKVQNVVLILADDQGAHLSSLGVKGISTPNVDQLASEGVLFNNAFAAVASCSPSRSSIMTGMYPHANGHWRNTITPSLKDAESEFGRDSKKVDKVGIHEYIKTLPELFLEHGFYTGITQKFHMSPPWKFPYDVKDPVNNEPKQYTKFVNNFIKQADGKPFFLQANISAPHRNFEHHVGKFPEFLPNPNSIQVPKYLPDTPEMRQDLMKYYGSVQIADACAGAIIKALKDKGIYDNTLIIYTSDQGEPYHRAKASAYFAGLHVPLVIAGPKVLKNKLNTSLVSLIDLMPTILDFVGIKNPETVQGKSLMPLLEGKNNDYAARNYVFGEHNSHGPDRDEHYPSRMVFDGRYYYIQNLMHDKSYKLPADLKEEKSWGNHSYNATLHAEFSHPIQFNLLKILESGRSSEELYDMKVDEGQTNNLIQDKNYLSKLKELRTAMSNWRLSSGDVADDPLLIKTRLKK